MQYIIVYETVSRGNWVADNARTENRERLLIHNDLASADAKLAYLREHGLNAKLAILAE